MPTKIIPGKILQYLNQLVHSYLKENGIIQLCDFSEAIESNKAIEASTANSVASGSNNSGASNGSRKVSFNLLTLINFVVIKPFLTHSLSLSSIHYFYP